MRFRKAINPSFNHQRLTGHTGCLYDDQTVIHDQEYDSYSAAERAMDAIIIEILTDQHEQGLIDDLAAAIEAEGVTITHLPSWPIDVEHAPEGWI